MSKGPNAMAMAKGQRGEVMKATKTMAKAGLLLALAVVLGCGCVVPGQSARPLEWVNPEPDGYYTGEPPDFACRFNPDPLERKFRVAYLRLRLESVEGLGGGEAIKAAAEKGADNFYGDYMGFREQARESPRGQSNHAPENKGLSDAFRGSIKSRFSYERSNISYFLSAADMLAAGGWSGAGGVLGEPVTREFARHWEDMRFLNAELAARYPGIFTTDESGFPLDVVMIGLYVKGYPPVRTRFEAWLVGLPEHADIKGYIGFFKPSEVFLDPYDAIAAAVFKVSYEQFGGLAPANPKDHDWTEKP